MRKAKASWGEKRVILCSFLNHAWQKENAEKRIDYKGAGLCLVASVVSNCPWDCPGKNSGVGYQFLLQGIFPNQGSNLGLLMPPALAGGFFNTSAAWKAQIINMAQQIGQFDESKHAEQNPWLQDAPKTKRAERQSIWNIQVYIITVKCFEFLLESYVKSDIY